MGTTALNLINSAARKIGVKGRGRGLPADEAFEWLTGLKRMLDSWSVEHLMIPYRTRETFSLTNAQSYTIGPNGDFDTTRPMSIDEAQVIDAAGYQYELTQVPIERWANLFTPGTTGRPRFFTYENGYPLATIRFDVIPYDPTLVLWTRKPIEAWQIEDLAVPSYPLAMTLTVGNNGLGQFGYNRATPFGALVPAYGTWQFLQTSDANVVRLRVVGSGKLNGLLTIPLTVNGYGTVTLIWSDANTDYRVTDAALAAFIIAADGTDLSIQVGSPFTGQRLPTSGFTDEMLQADIEFDVGYENAIVFNLAVQEAPNYQREASPTVMALAMQYKDQLKRQNFRQADAQIDSGLSRGVPGENFYDVIAGPG